jgi:parallel beta-helix repeat protein
MLMCILVLLGLPVLAQAATFWVSTNGSDSNRCTNRSTPLDFGAKRTVQAGIGCITAAGGSPHTLYIRQGSYNENIYPGNFHIPSGSGTGTEAADAPWPNAITIASAPGETATLTQPIGIQGNIDGSIPKYLIFDRLKIAMNFATPGDLFRTAGDTHHIRFSNGDMSGCNGGNAVQGTHFSSYVHIQNSKIHCEFGPDVAQYGFYGFYISFHDSIVEGNDVYNNPGYGMHLYSQGQNYVDNNTVRNNKFHDNCMSDPRGISLGGVIVASGGNNQFYNNLVYNNCLGTIGGPGVSVAYTHGDRNNQIYNNTIYNNGDGCISLGADSPGGGATQTKVRNNICANNNARGNNQPAIIDNSNGADGSTFSNNLCFPASSATGTPSGACSVTRP